MRDGEIIDIVAKTKSCHLLLIRVLLSFLIQPRHPLYLFLISPVASDPELAAGGEEEITDKSCKMRYAQVS